MSRTLYHVFRETYDAHITKEEYTELQGSYWTLEEANEAARRDLDDWSSDFWEEYEETVDEAGYVTIETLCPEGETMKVYIEAKEVPPEPVHSTSDAVYVIMQTEYVGPQDERGHSQLAIPTAYERLLEANEAASNLLHKALDKDQDEVKLEETNQDSTTDVYDGTAYVKMEGKDRVQIQVIRVAVQKAAIEAGRKRPRLEEEEEDSDSE